jgi:23S rRNA (cytosine1962-C5)-methyltransferase
MIEVTLAKGRDRSLRRRHPWVLSGSIESVRAGEGDPVGAWARVRSAEGEVLGYGHFSPASSIRVRMLIFDKQEPESELLADRICRAVARRREDPLLGGTDAVRLVNAEGDGLPGLVADRYDDLVVVKLTTAGMIARRDQIAVALREVTGAAAGFERADLAASRREAVTAVEGALWGVAPSAPVAIGERGRRYRVDAVRGQKTGFYLDQRDSRDLVGELAAGRRVLDLFCYSGGFAVAAAVGGAAEVNLVDSSAPALELARGNLAENAPGCPASLHQGDAFRFLRASEERYQLLVLDPPPLARHRAEVQRATRAYKDLLMRALRCAAPGALLLAFACTHHVGPDLFRKVVFAASLDAGRPLQVLRELAAPPDHPVSIYHPEGAYLSGLLLRA